MIFLVVFIIGESYCTSMISLLFIDTIIESLISFLSKKEAINFAVSQGFQLIDFILQHIHGTYYHRFTKIPHRICENPTIYNKIRCLCEYSEDLKLSKNLEPFPIPKNVRKLMFANHFNKKLEPGYIPQSVTVLYFGACFNTLIEPNVLPNGLIELYLNHSNQFNCNQGSCELEYGYEERLLPGVLPDSLKILEADSWNQKIEMGVLPQSLTEMRLHLYNQPLDPGILPQSLTHLYLASYDYPLIPGILPSNIITLRMNDYNHPLTPGVLPTTITNLQLDHYNFSLILPQNLIKLKLRNYDQPLVPGIFANGLTCLWLGEYNKSFITGTFPPTLRNLYLDKYDHPLIPGVLPDHLLVLKMNHYDKPLDQGVLPPCLEILKLNKFNQLITVDFPHTLHTLALCGLKDHSMSWSHIPKNLKKLRISDTDLIDNLNPDTKIPTLKISSSQCPTDSDDEDDYNDRCLWLFD